MLSVVSPGRFEQIIVGDITLTITNHPEWGKVQIAIDAPAGVDVVRLDPVADCRLPLDTPGWPVPVICDGATLDAAKARFALAGAR